MLDELGPYAQVQLSDLADFLETLVNFYEWKTPRKSLATLGFLLSCLFVTILTDMTFCMRIVGFVAGGTFFLCWPVASLYPKYRHIVSPFKWVFWDIPTHAEWSFQFLQREALSAKEARSSTRLEEARDRKQFNASKHDPVDLSTSTIHVQINEDSSSFDSEEEDWKSATSVASGLADDVIRSFRGFFGMKPGRLVVCFSGVRFVESLKRSEVWRLEYIDIGGMSKAESTPPTKILFSTEQLVIYHKSDSSFRIDGMKRRDEAFNAIIAFSALRWRNLQS